MDSTVTDNPQQEDSAVARFRARSLIRMTSPRTTDVQKRQKPAPLHAYYIRNIFVIIFLFI